MFRDALQGLRRGDFSRLERRFEGGVGPAGPRPLIIEWSDEGRFSDEPVALAEALTCACFLGRITVADYLLTRGVDPAAGAGTGLDALHWAANRGQLEAVRLLVRHKAPLETRSMYGSSVVGTAVWSAINEPGPIIFRSSKSYSMPTPVWRKWSIPQEIFRSMRSCVAGRNHEHGAAPFRFWSESPGT